MVLLSKKTVLEGEYSAWEIYDTFDETDTSPTTAFSSYAVFNRLETIAILCIVGGKQKTYTISSKTVSAAHSITSPENAYMTGKYMSSAFGTYYVIYNTNNLVIFKNGVEIATFSYEDLGLNVGDVESVSISPKGTYIAIAGEITATGNRGWVILVGS